MNDDDLAVAPAVYDLMIGSRLNYLCSLANC
jgi:hypothetical protein